MAGLSLSYLSPQRHSLYLGTRYCSTGTKAGVQVDGGAVQPLALRIENEDQLARIFLGEFEPGPHTVALTHAGADGDFLYFDFLEVALPVKRCRSSIPTPASPWRRTGTPTTRSR